MLAPFHLQAEVYKLNVNKHISEPFCSLVVVVPSCEQWSGGRIICMVAVSLFNPIHANKNVIPALKTARCSLPQTGYTLVKGIGSRKGGKEKGGGRGSNRTAGFHVEQWHF